MNKGPLRELQEVGMFEMYLIVGVKRSGDRLTIRGKEMEVPVMFRFLK